MALTTLYSQNPFSFHLNIPVREIIQSERTLKFLPSGDETREPVTLELPIGSEVKGLEHPDFRKFQDWVFTLIYSDTPGQFKLYLTRRFDIRIIEVTTPKTELILNVDFFQVHNHDPSRYRLDGKVIYDYSELFARTLTAWPSNYYLRTVIKHPWWQWVQRKGADGEKEMILLMCNPHPLDEDEQYSEAEITHEMWQKARRNFLIVEAIKKQIPRADSPSPDLYKSIIWLGHRGELDLWGCDGRFLAATWVHERKERIEMWDLGSYITPNTPEWVRDGLDRLTVFWPEFNHARKLA